MKEIDNCKYPIQLTQFKLDFRSPLSSGFLVANTLLMLIFFSVEAFSLESHDDTSQERNNMFMFNFGYTHIPKGADPHSPEEEGYFVPSLGLDYIRRLSHKWEVGIMLDYELDHYLIVEKDLERENAFIVVAGGAYNLIDHLAIFAGAGVEFEAHNHLFVFRLGTEYGIHLKRHWVIAPAFFFDWKEGYDTYALSLGVGYNF